MDDLSTLQARIQSSLITITRAASALANEDLPFHRSLSSSLASDLDQQNARLLGLASGLLGTASATEETVRPVASLKDIDSIDANWRAVVDVIDSLLERADTALDEFTGAVKRLSPGVVGEKASSSTTPRMSKIAMQLKAQEIEKPQLQFEHVPTNRESGSFKPLLRTKPHAIVPLEKEPISTDELTQEQYPHPYQLEIEQYRYPASVYTQADPIPYHPFDLTTATLVDSEEAVGDMLDELKQASEIAIDLEHHDQRSYVGIVSLMQISTRNKDWIVDTLKPWRRKLDCLNEVFANPNILKVLHGAYMDIVWLQRDLGLYIVGLFDTHYAARALGYPGGSLAYLLKRFADVEAQKQYQMADWRIRPLPQELFDYARSDTHYLLYIYDCMRNELIQRSDFSRPDHEGDKIWQVLEKSRETALQRYEHPIYDVELGQGSSGWYKILSRTPALFTKEQFAVFRAVHQWRDNVAREQDDSVHYVMPSHQVFTLAREIPATRAALLGLTQPATQSVRLRADELVRTIIQAKESGIDGPEMIDILNKIEPHNSRGFVDKAGPGIRPAAAYLPKEAISGASANGLSNGAVPSDSALALRTATSTFWGGAFDSSAHDQQRRMLSTAPSVQLTLPMPALTAEIFADGMPSSLPAAHNSTASSSPLAQLENENNEEDLDTNVPRLGSRKRKRNATKVDLTQAGTTDSMVAQNDEVSLDNEEEQLSREKLDRKKAKKEAKAAKRAASRAVGANSEAMTNGVAVVDEQEQPFDYASAPSILNPPREERDGAKDGRKKQVDPYRKALDTPKGLPRAPASKERAGRSMTYKS